MKVKIEITGEGRFKVTFKDGHSTEYQFFSHGEKCSVFAFPVNHSLAIKFCPVCGGSIFGGDTELRIKT